MATWIDLSGIGVFLDVYTDGNKKPGLTLLDVAGIHEVQIKRLGFKPAVGPLSKGVYVRSNTSFTLAMLNAAFGSANVNLVEVDLQDVKKDFAERLREMTAQNANTIFSQQRPIGFNYLGEIVQESVIGRYVVTEQDGMSRIHQENPGDPARFMYAGDRQQLALVAQGFVSRITKRGENLRREHVARLINVSNVAEFSEREYQEAIEVELTRLFQSESAALKASGAELLEFYDVANQIYVGAPDLRERTSNSVANNQYSTPLPLAVIAQAMSARRADLAGKLVLDPAIGNAALVSTLRGVGGSAVYGVEIDPQRVAQATPDVDAIILGDAATIDFKAEFEVRDGFDYVVANPPFSKLSQKVDVRLPAGSLVAEMSVGRLDHLILLNSLHARKDDGRAVFLIGADNAVSGGEVQGRSKALLNYLYDHYVVDGAVEISGELYKKQGADFPFRVIVVGARRDVPVQAEAPSVLPVLRTYDGVRDWAAGVIESGLGVGRDVDQLMENSIAEVLGGDQVDAKPVVADDRVENQYQQKYVAFSNAGEPSTMIPANLSGPVYEALAGIKDVYGDIDSYVAKKLRFEVSELSGYFLPEQVDALAMIFHGHERGLGFLLADQPGVGKGRVIAAVARHERLEGRIPMFVTLSDSLFTDFLERDIANINSRELFTKPLIVNDGSKTVDRDGNVVVRSLGRKKYTDFAATGMLPEGTDMVLLTYSQLARPAETSVTAKYMREVMANHQITILLDESHAGAGASNTSANLGEMIDKAQRVLYSSGTPIKGAKNLRLYKKILPRGIDADEILEVVQSDPLSMQEALNYEIAAQGCLISRELESTGIEKEYVVSKNVDRNRQIADQMSDILSTMSFISGDVKKVVSNISVELQAELLKIPEEERKDSRMSVTAINFGSRLHQINRQFLLSLKAPDVVAEALAALDQNKKPLIALQHTGESLIRDFVRAHTDAADDADTELSSRVVLERAVTFKDLMHKYLERILRIKVTGRYGEVTHRIADSVPIRRAKEQLSDLINALPDDLPLTPIDYVRERLAARGYTLAEVSGRTLRTQTLEDGRMVVEPMPNAGDRTKTNRVVREFCNGDVDVLLLTSSGSTGLSAQASPALGSDVRVRRMIKWEMQANITDERQIDGRPNRTGQIVLPEYAIPLSGLVADDRLAMQFNNKNRSLTSSTVANRDSKDLIRDVPDLLNVVGDIVAMQMLVERPELAMKLDIALPQEEMVSEASHRSLEYIGRLTGRIALLKVAQQETLYAELQSRFVEVLDRLKAEGRNPLEVDCHEWNATVVSRRAFMGKEQASAGPEKSALNSPIFLTELQYKRTLKAVRSSDVEKWVESRIRPVEVGQLDAQGIARHLVANRIEILTQYLGKKHTSIEAALQAKEPNETKNSAAKLEWLVTNLPLLKPGAVYYDFDIEGKKLPKVVGNVILPRSVDECMRLSDYMVTVMEPGSDGIQAKSLSSLFAANLMFEENDFQSTADVRAIFDEAEDGVVLRTVRVFDGNLFEATSMNLREKLGTKIVYTDVTGARQHGILVHAGIPDSRLEAVPERVRGIDELVGIVRRGGIISTVGVSTAKSNDKGIHVQRDGAHFRLAAPSSKFGGGGIYLDPVLAVISGKEKTNRFGLQFKSSRGLMVATVEEANLPKVLAYLGETKGEKFYVRDKRLLQSVRDSLVSDKNTAPAVK